MSLNGFPPNFENNMPIPSKVGIKKQSYDATIKFQVKWVVELPWAGWFIRKDGNLHIVKCRICIEVKGKDKLFVSKWDYFCKHVGHKKASKNIGFDMKKGIEFIPKFVNMLRTREHLLFPIGRLLMPNWHMGWQERKHEKLFNFLLSFICYSRAIQCQNIIIEAFV